MTSSASHVWPVIRNGVLSGQRSVLTCKRNLGNWVIPASLSRNRLQHPHDGLDTRTHWIHTGERELIGGSPQEPLRLRGTQSRGVERSPDEAHARIGEPRNRQVQRQRLFRRHHRHVRKS